MMQWVRKEEAIGKLLPTSHLLFTYHFLTPLIEEKAVIDYKNPKYLKKAPKLNQKLGFKHLRDFLHIFVEMDRNHDGFLTFEDFFAR